MAAPTTTSLTVTQQKAVTLREELFARKDQFAAAMPSWMTVDRLLRVVFTTSMSNPKILDCSKESIFGAIMQAAQVGLEPILGRAYLIPYNNSKYVNGAWVKTLECQFQAGYQGLIDLGRRSGAISDVYGMPVFDNDEFDMGLGTDRFLRHKPWYLNLNERKNGPGEIFGAYAIWILKDGTMHPEFMPLSDIYERRDKSQAYQYAIANPTNKKAQECPWIQWEKEMIVKTVIKHSSKMVPASIEFMEAVQFDNMAEAGAVPRMNPGKEPGSYFLLPGENDGIGAGNQDAELQGRFDQLINDRGVNSARAKEFVDYAARYYKADVSDALQNALENADNFIKEFGVWEKQKYPAKAVLTGSAGGGTAPTPKAPTLAEEIGRLKSVGLIEWEKTNHADIPHMAPEDKKFFHNKWLKVIGKDYFSEGQPGFKGAPTTEEEAAPPGQPPQQPVSDKEGQGDDEPPLPDEKDAPPLLAKQTVPTQGEATQASLFAEGEKVLKIAPWDKTRLYNQYCDILGEVKMNGLIEKHNITNLQTDSDLMVTKFFEGCDIEAKKVNKTA